MTKAEIKKRLIDKNVTETQMAKELGISRQYLSYIFSGKHKGYRYRARISTYLGIPLAILFDTDEQCNPNANENA